MRSLRLWLLPLVLLFSTLTLEAIAKPDPQSVQRDLEAFRTNPQKFMNQIPHKTYLGRGRPRRPARSIAEIAELRNRFRATLIERCQRGKCGAAWPRSLQPFAHRSSLLEGLLDPQELSITGQRIVYKASEIDALSLNSRVVSQKPWSDSYWPTYQGLAGSRYASGNFLQAGNEFSDYYAYILRPENALLATYLSQDETRLDELSPAEKYDLLIGNLSDNPMGYLTPFMWEEGQRYQMSEGKVERWFGLCHGWAPASFMVPRPERTVTVLAADGVTRVRFYPSDIKALATLLWANALPEMRYLGGRCETKDAQLDSDTGRILSDECFDVNPGDWHLAVVNQLGVAGRSMVMDASFDYEVWNQPLISYEFVYFNPKTGEVVDRLKDARVKLKSYDEDRFKKFRSPQAVAVVGVAMDVTYASENYPSHSEVDGAYTDLQMQTRYLYDLELNSKGEIIGGEWYQNAHPDFIWSVPVATKASSFMEFAAEGAWQPGQPVPLAWQYAAKMSAAAAQPLAGIVEQLVTWSTQAEPPVPKPINRPPATPTPAPQPEPVTEQPVPSPAPSPEPSPITEEPVPSPTPLPPMADEPAATPTPISPVIDEPSPTPLPPSVTETPAPEVPVTNVSAVPPASPSGRAE